MLLYSYWNSTSSWRVRIGLAWKALPYDYVAVNLMAHEQDAPAHHKRSPLGRVPVLELDDGSVLTESIAILHYLEETYPEPPLLPKQPFRRARARMLAELVNSGIQPLQNLAVLRYVKHVVHSDEQAWLAHWVEGGLAALELAVQPTAGTFSVGDAVSLADVYLVPQLAAARRSRIDLSPYPTLLRIEEACAALPAFIAAAPEKQPDFPGQ